MKSQKDLLESKVQISMADVKGNDEEHGVDIADLQQHKEIIEEKPLYGVEQMPQFPGGEDELFKFISDNLHYPAAASELGIEGRVTIRFVVSKTGAVTNVEVIRGLDPACDKEAIRVVRMMPNWIPGRQNGRNVPVYYTLPILYKLQK
jgi:protein TonB